MNIVDSSGWLEYFVDGSSADLFSEQNLIYNWKEVVSFCINPILDKYSSKL